MFLCQSHKWFVVRTMAEHKSLAEGGARVKFEARRRGTVEDFIRSSGCEEFYHTATVELADALTRMQEVGATPILPDGKVGGNACCRLSLSKGIDFLVVSKSGKYAGQAIDADNDFCIVTDFNVEQWSVEFYSNSDETLPSSDTPLHYFALHAAEKFNWTEVPFVTLHGHAIETEEAASLLHIPCSVVETLFSTPDDSHELMNLLHQFPYPQHKIFVRKGHGFIILGKRMTDALTVFEQSVVPHLANTP